MSKPEDSGLERDYCAGLLSLREMAERYGISEGAIRKRAKKNNWVRGKKPGTQKGAQVRKSGTQKQEMRTALEPEILECESQPDTEDNVPGEDEENITLPPELSCISPQQLIFAEHIARGKTRVEAYRLAGYTCDGATAYAAASRLYRNVKVSRAIRYFRDKYQRRYTAEIDEIVHQLVSIARADPNDLSQHRRVNCRYCWGEHHLYQWRDIAEFDKASAAAAKDGRKEPEYGGLGFVDTADPNPDCPKCCGEGIGQVFIPDTRDLDNDARWLYAGVKETKFGIEVQSSSQESARRELARLLASFNTSSRKNELAEKLIELEIRKRTAEAERLEQENAEKRAPGKAGEAPTIVINLVNSPDAE
ncbi:terminase small subunit [Cronobacter sp. EKM101R]|uniref:terminase small subunit n=1 Tax=unclassified Cronobacter TaxID=2649764 RepID=UPI0013ECF0FB|nr:MULTISPECIES: terminase small subunit [unclassified Cronobacter]KAF6596196.1 terminase small subunit [Cronobacter sp. EKM101R]KAF6599023.1 terminase small subunit [Cronobacter sp. EKM102R]